MIKCPKCGTKNQDDNIFCKKCGSVLNAKNMYGPEKESIVASKDLGNNRKTKDAISEQMKKEMAREISNNLNELMKDVWKKEDKELGSIEKKMEQSSLRELNELKARMIEDVRQIVERDLPIKVLEDVKKTMKEMWKKEDERLADIKKKMEVGDYGFFQKLHITKQFNDIKSEIEILKKTKIAVEKKIEEIFKLNLKKIREQTNKHVEDKVEEVGLDILERVYDEKRFKSFRDDLEQVKKIESRLENIFGSMNPTIERLDREVVRLKEDKASKSELRNLNKKIGGTEEMFEHPDKLDANLKKWESDRISKIEHRLKAMENKENKSNRKK